MGETWISESYICDNEKVKHNQMPLLLLIYDLLRHILLSLMLNTSIKVIATQYTDDHGWSQIREKEVNSVSNINKTNTYLSPLTFKRGQLWS